MWKEYFPRAQIVSLDYYDKTALQEDRIRIYHGSQDDPVLLQSKFFILILTYLEPLGAQTHVPTFHQ